MLNLLSGVSGFVVGLVLGVLIGLFAGYSFKNVMEWRKSYKNKDGDQSR